MALEWRLNQAAALRAGLTRNVIEPWFPRSVDQVDGGFLSSFDHRWRPLGRQDRLLEFQARQTRTAARLGIALPADGSWPGLVEHGLGRDDAYRLVQRAAMQTWEEARPFRDVLAEDPDVTAVLDSPALDACFDLKRSVARAGLAVDALDEPGTA